MRISADSELRDLDIAIIGMDCRFPGADNVTEFWNNLCGGVEALTYFTDEELLAAGVPESLIMHPDYVKQSFVLKDIEQFDAGFFGMTPREAALMDPQQRLLLESAWRLLESAGYNPESYGGSIGTYVGSGTSKYLLKNIMAAIDLDMTPEIRQIWMGNDVNFASTLISYKLNLKGPSMNVQTACSTSLTAVTLACQALLNYQCDMAIAGGCTLEVPQEAGYLYLPGEVLSQDGHCRPFDKNGTGTLAGSGAGLVLLKRLEDAVADRDHIVAVIKGTAFNNDGADKVGYSAPSVKGERNAIKSAQVLSEIDEETITYIEAHGTATPMGDPIEVQALSEAFREATDKTGFCALGAVKANIGHLDAAAGAAGLIKTALMLKHKKLVPSVNFNEINPNIELGTSPFYMNTELADWEPDCGVRRAGVSSFGIGGTNVHAVLEEAIETREPESGEDYHLLVLSARSRAAYGQKASELLQHLRNHEAEDFRNVLYTLNSGRKRFSYRGGLICASREELIAKLEQGLAGIRCDKENVKDTVFLFPGQGSQYPGMAKQLYRTKSVFRREMDACFAILKQRFGYDLREILFADPEIAASRERLEETQHTQIAVFVVEYCLGKQLMHWGITPKAMLGHSIGEYTAACLAGVFTLEDALKVVLQRGRIIQSLPKGDMLYVNMTEQEAMAYVSGKVSLALVNAERRVVLAGEREALQSVMEQMQEHTDCRILHTSHAFHSYMMRDAVEALAAVLRTVRLQPAALPVMSNVTGDWLRPEEATDVNYWIRHMTGTVRFKDAAVQLARQEYKHYIEVGPGKTLSVFMQDNLQGFGDYALYQVLRDVNHPADDNRFLLEFVQKAWVNGLTVNWPNYYGDEVLFRVPLPTYPFEKQRHWIMPGKKRAVEEEIRLDSGFVTEDGDVMEPLNNRPELSVSYAPPTHAIEESIAELLQEIMGIAPIGINDNFFELGGHSLLITQVILRIKELYGTELQLQQFMEAPTVKDVSELVLEALSASLDLSMIAE
ncbi:type I polyketide synthase ['Paenibacillus yunnanensis' Narsing Rao et al. 2020]|uniref:type I polyketide synthase n=1 Tax=Paenibacillus tengchongensis TaxID=2608684 RepID=UPI00124F2358|nr:type I polyketide synthase [Paenibacillus tengchongensis]